MQAFAQKMGYCLAPDPYHHHVKADVDGVLVLFPAGERGRFSPSPEFITAVLTLRLGSVVALIDNSLDQAEQKVLENAINNNASFSDDEKRSLHAYLTWQLHTPANMTGMKSRIELLGAAEKSAVGKVIVSVACSDGTAELRLPKSNSLRRFIQAWDWIPHPYQAISISIPQLKLLSFHLYQLISRRQGLRWMPTYLPATNLPLMMFVNY